MIKLTKSNDSQGAILYIDGLRRELDRDEVDQLYREIDSIRRQLNIDKQKHKSKMGEWLVIK